MRFVDTNILLYSLDLEPGNAVKSTIANEILASTDLVCGRRFESRMIWAV